MLMDLLQDLHVDLNSKNQEGETPILSALRMSRPCSFIMHLIQAGSDLNAINNLGQSSLHVALLHSSLDITHELLKHGTDIDAQDYDQQTPLHCAIINNDLEAVCMLLYYGADVTIQCKENKTPLSVAVYLKKTETVKTLLNYYDDISGTDVYGYTALHRAVWDRSPIVADLIEAGADVNTITPDDESVLQMAVSAADIELCKLIQPIFDYSLLLNRPYPFLAMNFFVLRERCSCSEWLNFMYLVLDSGVTFELVDELTDFRVEENFCGIVEYFINSELNIPADDKLKIILIFLSFGAEVTIADINKAFILCGFNEEVEVLLYCTDGYHKSGIPDYRPAEEYGLLPQANFVFSVENDFSNKRILQSCHDLFICDLYNQEIDFEELEKFVLKNLRFFALTSQMKQVLIQRHEDFLEEAPEVHQKLKMMPEVPSLIELSRNQSCSFIKQSLKMNRGYQYHDAVKRLNLPHHIRDILRFKIPIYD